MDQIYRIMEFYLFRTTISWIKNAISFLPLACTLGFPLCRQRTAEYGSGESASPTAGHGPEQHETVHRPFCAKGSADFRCSA